MKRPTVLRAATRLATMVKPRSHGLLEPREIGGREVVLSFIEVFREDFVGVGRDPRGSGVFLEVSLEEFPEIAALDLVLQRALDDLSDLLVVEREELGVLADSVDVERLEKAHVAGIFREVDLQSELLGVSDNPSFSRPTAILARIAECCGSFSWKRSLSSSFEKCRSVCLFSITFLLRHCFHTCRAYIFSSIVPHVTQRYTITFFFCPIR